MNYETVIRSLFLIFRLLGSTISEMIFTVDLKLVKGACAKPET